MGLAEVRIRLMRQSTPTMSNQKGPIVQSADLIPEVEYLDYSRFGIKKLNQETEDLKKLVGPVKDKDMLGREELKDGAAGQQQE